MNKILKIYPLGFGNAPYIGQIEVNDSGFGSKQTNIGVETIFVVDVSGSMGQNVGRVFNHYLPMALKKVGYGDDEMIKVITFSSNSRVLGYSIKTLKYSTQSAENLTYMSHGIANLAKVIQESNKEKFRILTISDGELNDQSETMIESTKLASLLKKTNKKINSSAVRLFTSSYGHPDTRGLSSVLQFNTVETSDTIIDINLAELEYSTEIVSDMFANLLRDNLGTLNYRLTVK
jgi:Mg-chelatase subunit ChlD